MSREIVLGDIAEIRLGKAFKTAIKDEENEGGFYLIQPKNISLDGKLKVNDLARVKLDRIQNTQILMSGDIIIRLRGPIFLVTIFDGKWDLPVITTNQNAVIRCNQKVISPYYLQWYLNSNLGRSYFDSVAEGTNINKITIKDILAMKINLPGLLQQNKIGDIQDNWLSQKDTYKKLIENGDLYFNELCINIQMVNDNENN